MTGPQSRRGGSWRGPTRTGTTPLRPVPDATERGDPVQRTVRRRLPGHPRDDEAGLVGQRHQAGAVAGASFVTSRET